MEDEEEIIDTKNIEIEKGHKFKTIASFKKSPALKKYVKSLKDHKRPYTKGYVDTLDKGDGYAHINVKINDKNDLYSPYSEFISEDFTEYIRDASSPISRLDAIAIDIEGGSLKQDEKKEFLTQFKYYYNLKYELSRREYHQTIFSAILLLLVGSLFLILEIVLVYGFGFDSNALIPQILTIVSWVFVWDATDVFFFQKRKVKSDSLLYFKLCFAPINFID